MSSHQGMSVLFLCCSVFFSLPVYAQQPAGEARPNIIHIMASDIGYDEIGAYGSRDMATPHLDLLARQGVMLNAHYSPHGSYSASLAATLTGRYAPRAGQGKGIHESSPDMPTGLDPENETTIAGLLSNQGYETGFVGQWELGHCVTCLPLSHGFNFFTGIPYAKDLGPERMNGTGLQHYPLIPVYSGTIPLIHCTNSQLAELPAYLQREACRFIQESVQNDKSFFLMYAPVETHVPWMVPEGFRQEGETGALTDAVRFLDRTLGIFMDLLTRLGIDNNTLIVITSGNGPPIGRDPELENSYGKYARVDTNHLHRLRGGKSQSRYEGGTRVPCIIRWPGKVPANSINEMITLGCDLFTTYAAVGGAPLPVGRVLDGKNLLPVLAGEQKEPVHLLYFGFEPDGMLMSVRYKNWKLVVPSNATASAAVQSEYELYQLDMDPGEMKDVAVKFPEIVDQLRQFGEKASMAIKENRALPAKNFIE